jgi:hypothetical protein
MYLKAGKKSFILLYLLFQIAVTSADAQTIIRGRVTDVQTFEPVVFANIVFKGTTIGTQTGFDGSYVLNGITGSDSILISFVGYETKTIGIIPDTEQNIDIHLNPALFSIAEVIIRPGENPAIKLLREVWRKMPENHIEKLSAYQYVNYSRSTLFVRKPGYYKKTDKTLEKVFSWEFEKYTVKTGEEDIPAIPSYFTEILSDNFFLKSTGQNFINIKSSHSEGIAFESTNLPAQLITKQENFNFMDNAVRIIDRSFISPLSRFGPLYYKYYLNDTSLIDNRYYCFRVDFVPKREEDPVFRGSFWINDTTFALKRISVEIGQKAELNFIRRAKIQQDYEPVDFEAWFPVSTRFMADAANLFVTNYSRKTDIVINKPREPGFYSSELKAGFDSENPDPDFWNRVRMNSLEKTDSLALQKIEVIKNTSRISIPAKLIEAAIRGYYDLGKFELGPYLLFYGYNETEGSRFRIGGRTNVRFSNRLIIEGYAAFGTRDNRLKGSVQTEYLLSEKYWTKAGLQIRDDVENSGAIDEFYSQSSFLTFASTFGGSDMMARSTVLRPWIGSDIIRGLQAKLVFTYKTFEPAGSDYHFAWYADPSRTDLRESFRTNELGLILHYQPKAVYVLDGNRRFSVNFNQYPVFGIEYFKGFRNPGNGDFNYDRIIAGIQHRFNLGGFGNVVYNVRFSRIFGSLPYPLLTTLAGNQSFFRTDRTYNLMNYGEFVADESLELFMSYHMNGLLLGKLPIIKKLEWRTVLSGKIAYGSFNDRSNGFYDPGTNPGGILPKTDTAGFPLTEFSTLTWKKPYAEISYGIENIFRFFRVDLVQRLTYLDNPESRNFAVMISGVFRF